MFGAMGVLLSNADGNYNRGNILRTGGRRGDTEHTANEHCLDLVRQYAIANVPQGI